jgi:phospholipid/cholesterol/gamma-HCH transport system substrate-binding protein
MAARANYVKIGLFVSLGLLAAAALGIALGALKLHRETIAYLTYFDEAVNGLELGAPVKARGVKIGRVEGIALAPDRRRVEVRMELDEKTLPRLGLPTGPHVIPPDLRAQIASQGLTGSTFVSIDFFEPDRNPPPVLTFTPPEHYIPAATSQLKSLEDSLTKAMDGLSTLIDTMVREGFSDKTMQAIGSADDVLADLHRFLTNLDRQSIPQRTAATIDQIRMAANKADSVLGRVDGDSGLVAATQRSMRSIADVGRSATGAARDLEETLGDIREAASALRLLAEELERQPDALLKGRAKQGSR